MAAMPSEMTGALLSQKRLISSQREVCWTGRRREKDLWAVRVWAWHLKKSILFVKSFKGRRQLLRFFARAPVPGRGVRGVTDASMVLVVRFCGRLWFAPGLEVWC